MEIERSIEEQQLQAILTKAEKNGFEFKTSSSFDELKYIGFGRFSVQITTEQQKSEFIFHINELLFNHNFAKSFFGDHEVCKNCFNKLKKIDWDTKKCSKCSIDLSSENSYMESWQYHLQHMVLENNILKYLNDHV